MRQLALALLAGGLLVTAGVLFERYRLEDIAYRSVSTSKLLEQARNGSTDATLYLELAKRSRAQYRYPDALEYLKKCKELRPDLADAYFEEGCVLRALGRNDDAIGPLKHAAELSPNRPEIPLELAQAYNRTGRLTQAIEAMRRYVDLEPQDDYGYFWLGAYTLSAGMFDVAERSLQKARALNPRRSVTYIALGNLKLRQNPGPKELHQALEIYQRAVELDPNDAEPVQLLATVYYRQQRYAEAAREFERALVIDPSVAEVYYPLGLTYAKMGEKAKSERCLKIADVYQIGKEAFRRPGGAIADSKPGAR